MLTGPGVEPGRRSHWAVAWGLPVLSSSSQDAIGHRTPRLTRPAWVPAAGKPEGVGHVDLWLTGLVATPCEQGDQGPPLGSSLANPDPARGRVGSGPELLATTGPGRSWRVHPRAVVPVQCLGRRCRGPDFLQL